jgi:hypothetical protein
MTDWAFFAGLAPASLPFPFEAKSFDLVSPPLASLPFSEWTFFSLSPDDLNVAPRGRGGASLDDPLPEPLLWSLVFLLGLFPLEALLLFPLDSLVLEGFLSADAGAPLD